MSPLPLIRRRWVRWSVYFFLLSWSTLVTVPFVLQRGWERPRSWDRLIIPTVGLAVLSAIVGALADDVVGSVGHEEREHEEVDPQADDYDDKPPSAG